MVPVSGRCVMQIWERLRLVSNPVPIRTLFYSKPESGMHATESFMTYSLSSYFGYNTRYNKSRHLGKFIV